MNPYEPIAIGTAVTHNPFTLHPYSENPSDQPGFESPQVQVPLVDPQNLNYGPSEASYPGQAPNQPAQYGLPSLDPERRRLEKEIKDIEAKLDSGCSYAYSIWIYMSIVISGLLFVPWCIGLIEELGRTALDGKRRYALVTELLWMILCIWVLRQSLLMKNAINMKSEEGVRRGFWMMLFFAVYYLSVLLARELLYELDFYTQNPNGLTSTVPMSYTIMRLKFEYIPPMLCNIVGAANVMNLLTKRDTLVLEWNTRYGTTATNLA